MSSHGWLCCSNFWAVPPLLLLLHSSCCIGTGSDDTELLSPPAVDTSSWSLLQTDWFRGKWHGRHTLFWEGSKRQKTANPLLFTWIQHEKVAINVSEVQAIEAAGPLTLLRALAYASDNPGSALSVAVETAHRRGEVRLHLLGVNFGLEPFMAWDAFLMGPLNPEQRRLVQAFDLPVTPFHGMNVKIVFSGTGDQSEKDISAQELKRFKGPFSKGYHEELRIGFYHEAVSDSPDLAMTMNAGFAHYPKMWYTTISRLRRRGVPFIVTGAGNQLERIYEYDRDIEPELRGQSLQLRLTSSRRIEQWHEYFLAPLFPGFEKAGEEQNPRTVVKYEDAEGHAVFERYMSRQERASLGLSQTEADEICSDAGGNRYMAGRAGYILTASSKNPFMFCDDHHPLYCNSNGVVLLLEPARNLEVQPSYHPPSGLFRDVLIEYTKCFPRKHQPCLTRQLSDALSDISTELIDEVFESANRACGL